MSEAPNLNESLSPYSERSPTNAQQYIETILADPEVVLEPRDLESARVFARGLFDGKISQELGCQSSKTLEEIYKFAATEAVQEFYLDYFFTEKGKEDLAVLGIDATSISSVEQALFDIEKIKTAASYKQREEISFRSKYWYRDSLAELLTGDPEHDSDQFDRTPIHVNYKPEKLIEYLEDLRAYKRFFWEVRRSLKIQEPTDLLRAETIVLDIYTARVNNMIASVYSNAIDLGLQLEHSPGSAPPGLTDRFKAAMPMVQRAVLRDRAKAASEISSYKQTMAKRIDFLKGGVSWRGSEFTPISPEVLKLAEEISRAEDGTEATKHATIFSPETIAKLEQTHWNAPQMKELAEDVVRGWGLLSSEVAEWDEVNKRDGFASDQKWQVVITPKKRNMSVSGTKRVFFIPEEFDRTLIQESPAGVLPGLAHELAHLIQNQYKDEIAASMPLALIDGRRTGALMESGTVGQEREVFAALGRPRPTNTHYLSALQTKLSGSNNLQTVRAFFDSYAKGRKLNQGQLAKARALAADRAMRLYRAGGYNSSPLVYIEQELLTRALDNFTPEQAAVIKLCCASFSLSDMAKLRRYGLVGIPKKLSYFPAQAVLETFSLKYLPSIV